MTETADVVIVGGGIEGAAAAWALAQRGVTDVFVAERNTVGSGMTGKSSGIVRCHYGVSSLAAMATVGLEVFEKAEEIFGADIGFRQTGYVVGVGEQNVDSLRKSLAAQRAVGVQTEEIDRSEVARMWPFADLSPFGAFGWEARGGYGDAYMTAQAFAVSARAAGVRIRQGTAVTGLSVVDDRVTGVRLADGTEISTGSVVVATGAWTQPVLAALRRRRPDPGGARADRHHRTRDGHRVRYPSSPIWSRCSTSGRRSAATSCSATATSPTPRKPIPTTTPTARPTTSSTSPSPRSATASPDSPTRRSPAATPAATTSLRTGTR